MKSKAKRWLAKLKARKAGPWADSDLIAAFQAGRELQRAHDARACELTLLQAAIMRGVKEGRVKNRPVIELPPKGRARERYLDLDEVRRLWVEVEKAEPRIRLMMWILLHTWARAGAVEDLTVGRVDLFRLGVIDFRNPKLRETKKRRGIVAISDELWPVLYDALYQYGPPWKEDRVIPPGPRGRFSTTYHKCKDVERRAGIDEPFVCRHVFRKTGPSHAAQAGESLEFIAEVLSDSIGTTRAHYAHFRPEHMRSTVNRGWLATPAVPPAS